MTFSEWSNKKKQEEGKKKTFSEWSNEKHGAADEDIAPVRTDRGFGNTRTTGTFGGEKDVAKTILSGENTRDANFLDITLNSLKRGYNTSRYGEESFDAMQGKDNEKSKYEEILAGDDYQFSPSSKLEAGVSGAFELLGQQVRQLTNPRTLGIAGAAAGATAVAGQVGPQILAPEEIITVPAAFTAGMAAGGAVSNLEIEAGLAYNEMLEAGISEKTAKEVALTVGSINAGLEALQIDELIDAYKITKATGATKTFTKRILDELVGRGINIAKETAQEVAQEGVTIAGTQFASKHDTGEKAYSAKEIGKRLGDTAVSSALSFGIMNAPATAKNTISIAKEQKVTNKLTENEQKVVDNVVADHTDTIEEALGGNAYGVQKNTAPQAESVADGQDLVYNGKRGEEYARTDEFRDLQAESQRMSDEEWNFYLRGGENEDVRRRVSAVLQRQMDTWRSSGGTHNGLLRLSGKDNQFNIYEGVSPSLFHDIFEVSRKYLKNGELVDLHTVETTDDGIGYNDCRNYLSEDGLSGFSITPDGDLISVFNAGGKGGFLRAIRDVVKENSKTLDCYASPDQNLMEMYQNVFGFKAAAVMDYNMEYDHDNIAKNHDYPKVAFMVNTESDVETRTFTKDEYDEAVEYRNSFVNQTTRDRVVSFMPENNSDIRNSLSDSLSNPEMDDAKQRQLDIILESNPANDDYHTWIRSVDDILTFEEALNHDDYVDYKGEDFDKSYPYSVAEEALRTGKITVYSSYPIEQGVFVTPSKMEAQSYAVGGKVYSKEVGIDDVAWIDPTQGQYAKVESDIRYSVSEDTPIRNDIALDDIPIRETVAENATVAERVIDDLPIRDDANAPIKTVKERHEAKVAAVRTELSNNKTLREDSLALYNQEIAELQAEYESKKKKDTKTAQGILRRIERLTRLRDSTDADYEKRISDLETKAEKMNTSAYQTAMQRMEKQQEYSEQMETLVGDTTSWVDKKLGISYKTNTLKRNLRDVVRDVNGKRDITKADAIYDELQGKYNHNEALLNREANKIKKAYAELRITKAEDVYIQMLGELRHNPDTDLTEADVKDFYKKHKGSIDEAKVDKVIEDARKTYDELLVRVNEVLREQGMKEIPYRKGYFPHFTEDKQSFLAKLFNWKTRNNDIPTDIAGLTETFNPSRSWQSFNKRRTSDTTDYSFTKGLDTYVQGALDWVYHIEDIQKRRAFENYIRYVHSDAGVQERIDTIRKSEEYDADEMQDQIDLVLAEAANPLNNFVTDLRAGTNALANKKSSMDRGTEEYLNRKFYSTMTNISNRVSANMVGGSISSALTNFIPITQSWGEVSPISSLKAMSDTIRATFRDDGMIDKSDFLTNRLKKSENLYKTGWDKVSDAAGILMEAIDGFTSQTVWRSKYLENLSNKMSENEAIKNADEFAEGVMAGRSRGNMPTIFNAKNPVAKMFTAFQLEVANQYGYMFKDMPQDMKSDSIAKLVKGYATMFLGAYAYNALYSSLTGRDSAFDPIGIIEDLLRDLGWIGDDEEEEPVDVAMNLTENILEEVPFVGGMLGGGRVPISSAIPYDGNVLDMVAGAGSILEGDLSDLTSEWLKPAYYLALPIGGGQIKKTVEGLSMFDDDLPIAGSYTKSGSLRFPVEDTIGSKVKAGIFGQWSSKNARDYIENERSPLKEKQIQEFIDMDIPISDYWEYREGMSGLSKLSEKADYISRLDLPIDKKNILINNIADRKEDIDMTGYENFDSFEEFDFAANNPDKYEIAQAVGGYDKYVKYQEGMKGMKLAEKVDYVSGLDLTTEQKNTLINGETDRKEPIDLTGYDRSVYSSFEEFEWAKDNPGRYAVAQAIGGYDAYTRYTKKLNSIQADKDASGKAINGSAKKKKVEYINSLDIDYMSKLILFKSEYNSDHSFNREIIGYIGDRKDLTFDEKATILRELGFTVSDDGAVKWG